MMVIAMIYFPELRNQTASYYNALMETYRLAVELSFTDPDWKTGARISKYRVTHNLPENTLQVESEALDDLIEKYAAKYTRA
jgi:hypothetical protein